MEDPRLQPDRDSRVLLPAAEPNAPVPSYRLFADAHSDGDAVASDGLSLREYWQVLMCRKGTIALTVAFFLILAYVYVSQKDPLYRATATVEIQDFNESFLNIRDVTAIGDSYSWDAHVATQIQILESKAFIDKVVDRLQLDKRPEFIEMLQPAEGKEAPDSSPQKPERTPKEKIASMVRGNLVALPEGLSRILALSFDWVEPEFAAEFVNAVAAAYKQEVMESRWQSTQQTTEYLEKKLEDLKKELQNSEAALQQYANQTGLMYTNEKQSVEEERLRQLQAEWSQAQANRVARQSQYEIATNATTDTLPEVLDDATLRQYQGRLTELRRELAQLETRFKPTYPRIQELQAQIGEMEGAVRRDSGKVLERIRNEYDSALRRERLLSAEYRTQAGVVTQQSGKAIQYKMLQQEVDSNRQLYDSMLQKLREAGIASAMKASAVRIVDLAEPPRAPFSPNVTLTMAGGMFVGLCLGVLIAFVRDSMDCSVRMPGDSSRFLRLAELGVIPSRDTVPRYAGESLLSSWRRPLLGAGRDEKPGNYRKRWSPLAEYFRVTLTSILFADSRGSVPKLLVVTSPGPGEGKSSVVSNLAITLAEIGKRVLLVDADMRKPRLHEIFNLPNTWGLSDLLKSEVPVESCPLEAIARSTGISGLYVLPSGPGSSSIARLLYSTCGRRLLERLRGEFDTVIVDTPPMLQISDARVIGRLADGVILVLRSGQTSRDSARAAKERLQADGIPILGTVLNGWNPKQYGYGAYDNYEAYGRYYHSVNEEKGRA